MTNHLSPITHSKNRNSFTLIELLVVLALVAILSVVVVMTLNPTELLKQARDSNRLSDLSTINTALNLFSTDVISGFMGTSTIVYVSIPSTLSDCSNLGLPTLPAGYAYNCAASQNLRNTDGTGWIPVNFQRISSNSPISQLPIDPVNTTSTRLYYTYVSGGSWELSASVEASKNKLGGSNDLTSKDGGGATSLYEVGNNLNLNPIETGDASLVGYWNFEEGPSATSTDRSGYGNNGIWHGTSTQSQHYTSGKVGNYAGSFNQANDYVENTTMNPAAPSDNFSVGAWAYPLNVSISNGAVVNLGYNSGYDFEIRTSWQIRLGSVAWIDSGVNAIENVWTHILITRSGGAWSMYINGVKTALSGSTSPNNVTNNVRIGFTSWSDYIGYVDDVRVYNRALSAAEILALYNATK